MYSKEEAIQTALNMERTLSIQNHIFLGNRKNPPSLNVYKDEKQFYDSQKNHVHIGALGPVDYFHVKDQEEYISGLEFLFGHENQHVRSTASEPYQYGVMHGTYAMIEYIAQKEGYKKVFRKDNDYEAFLHELRKDGIYVDFKNLFKLNCQTINSIEDGRIERIRSLEFPGFAQQRKYFRGLEWMMGDEEFPDPDSMKPHEKLAVLLDVIHSLATTGLYPKGFVMKFAGTPLFDEVKALMPFIARAVLAGRTRKMADNYIEIAKRLAPVVYEVFKRNTNDMNNILEQMLKSMLSQLLGSDGMNSSDTSEREEEVGNELPCSVFEQSDLVVVLDDETYDKLMEQAKEQKNQSGMGIMVVREHPKEENTPDRDDKKSAKGGNKSSKCKNEDSQSSQSTSSEQGQGSAQSTDKGNDAGQNGDEGNSSGDSQGKGNGSKPNNADGDKQAGDGKNSDSDYDKEYSCGEGNSQNGQESGSHSAGGGRTGTIAEVEQQMKEAAAQCRAEAAETVSIINSSVLESAASERSIPIIEDKDKVVDPKKVKDICSDFKEVKRIYKLDKPLPPVLKARGSALRKKNERYFRSLSSPTTRHQSNGKIDSSRLTALCYGETNIFKKIGVDKKFDGCIYLLLDNSGSMSGAKRQEACKAAAVIEEGFKGLIPLKIVAYDTNGTVIHEVVKGWDESQKMNCCWNFACHGRSGCGNDDNYDILIAQRELLARPESKKLLIVASDGAPCDVEATRRAVEDTRKKGIEVFGIYFERGRIGNDASQFKHMYQKDYVCCELSQLDEQLTKLLIKFSRK